MIIDREGRDHYAVSLKDQIQVKFGDIHHPEEALAKLDKLQ